MSNYIGKKFDVVIGNPPYQDPKNKNRAFPMWAKFVIKSINDLCVENGYVAMITPQAWITANNVARETIINNKVEFISFDSKRFFDVGSTFSHYIIKNEKSNEKHTTTIVHSGIEYKERLYNKPFVVRGKLEASIVNKLLEHTDKLSLQSVGSPFRSDSKLNVQDKEDKSFKHPLFHINTKNLYSKEKHPCLDEIKVIINKTGKWKPFVDRGTMGFTHINYAVLTKSLEEAKRVEKYLNSNVINTFINIMNVFGARDKFTIEQIPSIQLTKNFDDNYLYNFFKLTEEEIKFVEDNS